MARVIRLQSDSNAHDRPWRVAVEQGFFKDEGLDVEYNEDNPKAWSHGAGHLAGTHRMGTSPNNSVVDRRQRTWAHENLYLAGCGNMPTIGTSNPTLTMSALAFAAAEKILQDLK